MTALWAWALAAVLAALGCGLWRPLARRLGFIDAPNHRSLHERPMVRSGGLPMALGVALVLGGLVVLDRVAFPPGLVLALLLAAGLVLVSAVDDRYSLPVLPRLGSHLIACAALIAFGISVPDWPLMLLIPAAVAATLGLAWMANLYNFMDGSDGLAGGQGAIGFAALGGMALMGAEPDTAAAAVAFTVSGACAGFLLWNAPPAKLFLGDAGAVPLGYLAGALMLHLWLATGHSPWLLALPFAPFWLDATATLARRILRGERFWQAHRQHHYQHLVQSGLGHRGTALIYWALMAFCGAIALIGARADSLALHLGLFGLVMGLLAAIGLLIRRRTIHP